MAPCVIRQHNTKVSIESSTDDQKRYVVHFVVRGAFTDEPLARFSMNDCTFDTEMAPEKTFLVTDSIYRALQTWPESHPDVVDAITWDSGRKWEVALRTIEIARSQSVSANLLQLV